MAFKCLECGHIFELGEAYEYVETHGLDCPPYETFKVCPICKNQFEETKTCKICKGEFLSEELNGNCICDDCLSDYYYDVDICYNIAKQDKQEIKINGLLATIFDEAEIEQILFDFLKNDDKKIDFSKYIEEDKDWFADKLAKEVSKQ